MTGTTATVAGTLEFEDTDLVSAVRRGDDRAFEELYRRYHSRIAAYVRGMVKDHARAEDVTQEIFFSALRRMRETERPIAFKPWVYEIARNACIDQYRRSSRAEELSYDAEDSLGASDYGRLVSADAEPDDAVESKQRLNHLCGAFGGLSDTHHQVLVLRELEGLSYREIGERLGMSRPAVESTLFRARRRLGEEYDELVSGRRCEKVQSIIATATQGMLGARDRRRVERHLTSCQACRREARLLGVDEQLVARRSVASRIAALIPVPFFLRRGRGSAQGSAGTGTAGQLAQISTALGAAAEPLAATWAKATAALTALALVSVSTGAATQEQGRAVRGFDDLPLVQALSAAKGDGSTAFQRSAMGASSKDALSAPSDAKGSSVSAAVQSGTASLTGGGGGSQPSAAGGRGGVLSELTAPDGPLARVPARPAGLPDAPGVNLPTSSERPAAPQAPQSPQQSSGGDGSGTGSAPQSPTSAPTAAPEAPQRPSVPVVDAAAVVQTVSG